jgi:prophage tail gpP-like protein
MEIRFDGQRYGHWQAVDIRASVDDLCAGVRLALTAPGDGSDLGINKNTVIQVLVDGAVVATVRPDVLTRSVSASSHTLHLEGRSLGRELVDCQYSATWRGLKLGEIAKRLCGLFKVPVKVVSDTAVVPDFSMQCELPANVLINAARAGNLLIYPTPDGGVVISEPTEAAPVAVLQYGAHFTHYTVVDEYRLQFSHYVVKSFDYGSEAGGAISGAVKDAAMTFFRPLHIVADRAGHSLGACARRAELERDRRLARSKRIELALPGWSHAGGLWDINTQVRVVIPGEGIDDVFLIGERRFTLDEKGGRVTHLLAMRRDAFRGFEKKKARRGAGGKGRTRK